MTIREREFKLWMSPLTYYWCYVNYIHYHVSLRSTKISQEFHFSVATNNLDTTFHSLKKPQLHADAAHRFMKLKHSTKCVFVYALYGYQQILHSNFILIANIVLTYDVQTKISIDEDWIPDLLFNHIKYLISVSF